MKKYILFDDATLKSVKTIWAEDHTHIGVQHKREITITGILVLFFIGAIIGISCIYHNTKNKLYQSEIAAMEDRLNVVENKTDLMSMVGYYTVTKDTDPLTDSAVYEFIKKCNMWYPDLVMAQYKLESASGTSDVYVNSYNLFGMKKVTRRPTTQLPHIDYKGYGMYNNWQMSVIDHVLWDYWTFSDCKPSREAYIAKLDAIYAEDSNYAAKISAIAKNY